MNVRRSCFPHRLRPMGIDPDLRLKREGIEVKGLAADTPLGKRGEWIGAWKKLLPPTKKN